MKLDKIDFLKNISKNQIIVLVGYAIMLIAVIVVSTLVFKFSVVPICTIVILEAVLATLLNKIPIWVHGLIIIAQIVAGIINKSIVFMVLMVAVYIIAITLLYMWDSLSDDDDDIVYEEE